MHVIHGRNLNTIFPQALAHLNLWGQRRDSRNGPVLVCPVPVTTVYQHPTERVLLDPRRDANPFFHFFEGLWMLSGRNDVAFPARFAKQLRQYSDDGRTLHGAYGWRWRRAFGMDQLKVIIDTLKSNPADRRCVLQMWDANEDLGKAGKDFPCNTHIYFQINSHGQLDMTVCNRSNDIIWGCYGANAVHFSMLHEYMAMSICVPIGTYYQMSNNWHAYTEVFEKYRSIIEDPPFQDPYGAGEVRDFPMVNGTGMTEWNEDLSVFMDEGPIVGFRDAFFRRVVTPMWHAHEAYREIKDESRFDRAREILAQCHATDWRLAATEWIDRRERAHKRAMDDGPVYE